MKEEEAVDRDKVLNEIGRGYIEMRHNRARGFMVLLDDNSEKMSVIVYNMPQDEFVCVAIRMVEDALEEIEGDKDD